MLTHDEILQLGNMLSETFKQMATLDAAILVLIVTIVEKVFTPQEFIGNRPKTWLLLASLSAFVVSLGASLWALLSIPASTVNMLEGGSTTTWVDDWSFYVSMVSFTVGIFVFIALAYISFFTRSKSAPSQPH